ncbi:hypothetical protein C8R43DRAFT_1082298 [Mycena crocata]|nr:hypothetical protein C8R43DRAFT_1082298 [Mycena crocata]
MPPRTRTSDRRLIELGVPVNTTGLPALPVEILHEITSYLTSVPVPCKDFHVLSRIYLERSTTLRALSETSKRLRSVFLAAAWERVEVCATVKVPDDYRHPSRVGSNKDIWSHDLTVDFARELVRQMEIVTIRNPVLAQEVKVVTVVLSERSADTIFPEFFRFLGQLPRLHTIQILRLGPPWKMLDFFQYNATTDHAFRSVRRLELCNNAMNIVKCCPSVERVSIEFIDSHGLKQLQIHAPKLCVLTCLPIGGERVQAIIDHLPNLAEIPPILTRDLSISTISLLSRMQNLRQIDLVAENGLMGAHIVALVAAAKQVLHASPSEAAEKCVTMKLGGVKGTLQKYLV